MKILSLYWGFCASAAILVDDQVVAATHEERFTRVKNDDSFPGKAIVYCLSEAGLSAQDLDAVAIASYFQGFDYTLVRTALWNIEDYLLEQEKCWYPKFYQNKQVDRLEAFRHKVDLNFYPEHYWKAHVGSADRNERFCRDREKIVADFLNIEISKVRRIEHHRCHAAYSYYASPLRGEEVLAFTMDGWGDGFNATIGIFDAKGNYQRVYETNECNIGRIYRYITLLLGMKPNEHEYKVMGLAPYGKEKYAGKALDVFRSTLYVDGIEFKWKVRPPDSYFWFKDKLQGVRFDHIAFALQLWVEELLVTWVKNAVGKFGIGKIVFSGGVGMNVKAMGKLVKLPEVENIFVGASPADESMAISAAILLAQDLAEESKEAWDSAKIKPLQHLYLGPQAIEAEELQAVSGLAKERYEITPAPGSSRIARLLAGGKVLARCCGRMEFGQRALGNRSILADPVNTEVKDRINAMIKSRDFWMPFAPVIMDKYASRYLINPKNLESPNMTLTFDTSEEGFAALKAACHPADRTTRPQILRKEANPQLYCLLEEFEKITKRGGLLNTSFNLHGYPIVNTPHEALDVLVNSSLDGLILNNYLILKR